MGHIVRISDFRRRDRHTYFNRGELCRLLALYSARVARGEWRDYAIDHTAGAALFSVFRHSFDRPLFTVAKVVGSGHEPDYQLLSGRQRLGRSSNLDELLALLDRKLAPVPAE